MRVVVGVGLCVGLRVGLGVGGLMGVCVVLPFVLFRFLWRLLLPAFDIGFSCVSFTCKGIGWYEKEKVLECGEKRVRTSAHMLLFGRAHAAHPILSDLDGADIVF